MRSLNATALILSQILLFYSIRPTLIVQVGFLKSQVLDAVIEKLYICTLKTMQKALIEIQQSPLYHLSAAPAMD